MVAVTTMVVAMSSSSSALIAVNAAQRKSVFMMGILFPSCMLRRNTVFRTHGTNERNSEPPQRFRCWSCYSKTDLERLMQSRGGLRGKNGWQAIQETWLTKVCLLQFPLPLGIYLTFKHCNDIVNNPAMNFGWHDPGYIHSAVMTILQPSSRYNYRYGSHMLGLEYWSKRAYIGLAIQAAIYRPKQVHHS